MRRRVSSRAVTSMLRFLGGIRTGKGKMEKVACFTKKKKSKKNGGKNVSKIMKQNKHELRKGS